jgi:hypothetical protein
MSETVKYNNPAALAKPFGEQIVVSLLHHSAFAHRAFGASGRLAQRAKKRARPLTAARGTLPRYPSSRGTSHPSDCAA